MNEEVRRACIKAGAKLGIGLSLVVALIGIRLVTATPAGLEAGLDELERLDAEIAAESTPAEKNETNDTQPKVSDDDSIVSRLGAGMREQLGPAEAENQGGDQLVSCRLGGATQFMRAHDCAMRGGKATVLSRER
jgi:hypothetical protein